MSASEILKSTVVPILGGIIATIMFASPSAAVFKARNRGSIGSLNPLPFVMAMANCVAWTTYAFLIDDWYLVIPNSLGCLIASFLFLVSYGIGMPNQRARDMVSLAFMVLGLLLFTVAILERMVVDSLDTKKQMWGYTANLILVFYFLAPLSTLLHVLRQRDSSSLVLALSIMNTINGLLWGTYGIAALGDPFVWAPNAFGAALGLIQVFLKVTIPSKEDLAEKEQAYTLPHHNSPSGSNTTSAATAPPESDIPAAKPNASSLTDATEAAAPADFQSHKNGVFSPASKNVHHRTPQQQYLTVNPASFRPELRVE